MDLKGLKTLVVDDNATTRTILREILGVWGASATEVEDSYQALSELDRASKQNEPYQLVLLDQSMPDMDGFEVAEHIKETQDNADIAIMMLTSHNRRDGIAHCQESDIPHYLVKPVKPSSLLHAITATTTRGLMRVAAEGPPPVARPATPEDQRPIRILLVDDSKSNRTLVQAYLKDTPCEINIAENGEIAVGKYISGEYDLVLMDMQMPVMDGYTTTKAIRQWESERGVRPTPIIALTASALKADDHKSLDAGCTAHITKPIKKATLIETIYEHTRGVRV